MATIEQCMLAALGIPATLEAEAAAQALGCDFGFEVGRMIDRPLATRIWGDWYNDDPGIADDRTCASFQAFLRGGVEMGLSLMRFGEAGVGPCDFAGGAETWVTAFERTVGGRARCELRLGLPPGRREHLLSALASGPDETWDGAINFLREGLFNELGIVFPRFVLHDDETLDADSILIIWNDLVLPPQRLIHADQLLVNTTPSELWKSAGVVAEEAINPAHFGRSALAPRSAYPECAAAGLGCWGDIGYAVLLIASVLRRAAGAFVNRHFVDMQLDSLETVFPELVRELDARLDRDRLTAALRRLAAEQVSIRNLPRILTALSAMDFASGFADMQARRRKHDLLGAGIRPGGRGAKLSVLSDAGRLDAPEALAGGTIDALVNRAREALRRQIVVGYSQQTTMVVYLLAPSLEDRLRNAAPLDVEEQGALRDAITALAIAAGHQTVFLTTPDVRRRALEAIRLHVRLARVVSYNELPPEWRIQPAGRLNPTLPARLAVP